MATLKFFWNGIKDERGRIQLCSYSNAPLISYPAGTITIYKRDYKPFSAGVREAFSVENQSELQSDYFEKDRIRVMPSHPLHEQVLIAMTAKFHR